MAQKAQTYLGWRKAGSRFQVWVSRIPGCHTGVSLYKNADRVSQHTLTTRSAEIPEQGITWGSSDETHRFMLPKYRRNLLGNYRDQAQRGHVKNVHSFAAAAVCFLLTVPGSQSHCLSNQVFFWMLHYLLPTWLDHQGGSSSWCQLVSYSTPVFMRPRKPLPEPLGRWLQLSPQSFLGRAFIVTLSRLYSFLGSWKDNLSLPTLLDTLRYTAAAVKYHLGAVAARQIWIQALVVKRIHSQYSWIMRYLHIRQTS